MAAMQVASGGWLGSFFVKFDPGKGKKEAEAAENLVKKSGLPTSSSDQGTQAILMGPPGAGKGTQVHIHVYNIHIPTAERFCGL